MTTHAEKEKAEQCAICSTYTVRTYCGIIIAEHKNLLSERPSCKRCKRSLKIKVGSKTSHNNRMVATITQRHT